VCPHTAAGESTGGDWEKEKIKKEKGIDDQMKEILD
jgi:hypothetical protein